MWTDAFAEGIWQTHMAHQNNAIAPIQGVRFYFYPKIDDIDEVVSEDQRVRGHAGYIAVLPETARLSNREIGIISVSLESKRTVLQSNEGVPKFRYPIIDGDTMQGAGGRVLDIRRLCFQLPV